MEMMKHDILWELLMGSTVVDTYLQEIIDALIPKNITAQEKELLIITYIELIKTNALLYTLLETKDPYNRYSILPALEVTDISGNLDMMDIVNNVKSLNLMPYTRDYSFSEILLIALETLIQSL